MTNEEIRERAREIVEIASKTTKSDDKIVHLVWLVQGLSHWHRTGGKVGNHPEMVRRVLVATVLDLIEGGNRYLSEDQEDAK